VAEANVLRDRARAWRAFKYCCRGAPNGVQQGGSWDEGPWSFSTAVMLRGRPVIKGIGGRCVRNGTAAKAALGATPCVADSGADGDPQHPALARAIYTAPALERFGE
jgi:hypothetical protein